jgi:hypothetical protein
VGYTICPSIDICPNAGQWEWLELASEGQAGMIADRRAERSVTLVPMMTGCPSRSCKSHHPREIPPYKSFLSSSFTLLIE